MKIHLLTILSIIIVFLIILSWFIYPISYFITIGIIIGSFLYYTMWIWK